MEEKKKIDDGGPAFPVPYHPDQEWENPSGISVRDYFAASAMQRLVNDKAACLLLDGAPEFPLQMNIAEVAYKFADAMLRERSK